MQLLSSKKLVVLGSINVDHIINIDKFPSPGETVQGEQYLTAFGGKGANQAVAAGRCRANIKFIASIGDDAVGLNVKQQLMKDNIDISAINIEKGYSTGVALIFVNKEGENSIAIDSGANKHLTIEKIKQYKHSITNADALLMQLESPLETVLQAAKWANESKTKVILNPAPANQLSDELLSYIDIITPNETEAEVLTGIKVTSEQSAQLASNILHNRGVKTVLITLGSKGVWLSEEGKGQIIAAFKVNAIDTIAAGDTFNGVLVTTLLENRPIELAIKYAHAAAAIAVTRKGAQPSIPWRDEIDAFLICK